MNKELNMPYRCKGCGYETDSIPPGRCPGCNRVIVRIEGSPPNRLPWIIVPLGGVVALAVFLVIPDSFQRPRQLDDFLAESSPTRLDPDSETEWLNVWGVSIPSGELAVADPTLFPSARVIAKLPQETYYEIDVKLRVEAGAFCVAGLCVRPEWHCRLL